MASKHKLITKVRKKKTTFTQKHVTCISLNTNNYFIHRAAVSAACVNGWMQTCNVDCHFNGIHVFICTRCCHSNEHLATSIKIMWWHLCRFMHLYHGVEFFCSCSGLNLHLRATSLASFNTSYFAVLFNFWKQQVQPQSGILGQ